MREREREREREEGGGGGITVKGQGRKQKGQKGRHLAALSLRRCVQTEESE